MKYTFLIALFFTVSSFSNDETEAKKSCIDVLSTQTYKNGESMQSLCDLNTQPKDYWECVHLRIKNEETFRFADNACKKLKS